MNDVSHARPIRHALFMLVGTVAVGTSAYYLIEGWSALDSFYMVVITLSTVGFHEVQPLSHLGQIVTIGVILSGLFSLTFLGAGVSRLILEGEIRRVTLPTNRL